MAWFIFPASSENTRKCTIFSARRAASSAVSVGAMPSRIRYPALICPQISPSIWTDASLTRVTTARKKSPLSVQRAYYSMLLWRSLSQPAKKDASSSVSANWSHVPIVSRAECIPRMGAPMSMVRIGICVERIDPSVAPPAASEWFVKTW